MNGNQAGPQGRRPVTGGTAPLSPAVCRVLPGEVRTAVAAEFRFDAADALLVTVVLRPPNGPAVVWQLGRDLLWDGLLDPSGTGDVRVWPAGAAGGRPQLRILLTGAGAGALLEADRDALQEWLAGTYRLVPAGAELDGVDWDAFAGRLTEER